MEQANRLCPFCGGPVDEDGWLAESGERGPECEDCGATACSIEDWNSRYSPSVPPDAELDLLVECLAILSTDDASSYADEQKIKLLRSAKDAIQSLRALHAKDPQP